MMTVKTMFLPVGVSLLLGSLLVGPFSMGSAQAEETMQWGNSLSQTLASQILNREVNRSYWRQNYLSSNNEASLWDGEPVLRFTDPEGQPIDRDSFLQEIWKGALP